MADTSTDTRNAGFFYYRIAGDSHFHGHTLTRGSFSHTHTHAGGDSVHTHEPADSVRRSGEAG